MQGGQWKGRRRRKTRFRRFRWERLALTVACVGMIVFALVEIIGYGKEYDIKELGKQLKKLGMLIVQDQVWGRVTENRAEGKSTR